MVCSLSGSSVYGILQARILEWVSISYSRNLPNPGIKPRSPAFQMDSLLLNHQGCFSRGFPGGTVVKNLPANAGDTGDVGPILGQEDPLEEEMVTHSSILAWKILWTEESGGLQSMGLQKSQT